MKNNVAESSASALQSFLFCSSVPSHSSHLLWDFRENIWGSLVAGSLILPWLSLTKLVFLSIVPDHALEHKYNQSSGPLPTAFVQMRAEGKRCCAHCYFEYSILEMSEFAVVHTVLATHSLNLVADR